jgi:type VI protein secretion system component VasA
MATVTVQDMTILSSGLTPSYAAGDAAETYLIPNNGDMFVHVKKSGAGSCTVTVATPNTVQGLAITDYTATVPATTGDKMIGPFAPADFNNSAGQILVTFSEVTGLTFAAIRFPSMRR